MKGGEKEAKDTGHLLCGLKGSCFKGDVQEHTIWSFYSRAIPGSPLSLSLPPTQFCGKSYTALNQRTGWSIASERNVKNWEIIPFPVETINKEG